MEVIIMDAKNILNYIEDAEQKIEKSKGLLSKAEGRLEMLEQQRQQVINEITQMGLNPQNLDSTIQSLEFEIQKDLETIRNNIPDFIE